MAIAPKSCKLEGFFLTPSRTSITQSPATNDPPDHCSQLFPERDFHVVDYKCCVAVALFLEGGLQSAVQLYFVIQQLWKNERPSCDASRQDSVKTLCSAARALIINAQKNPHQHSTFYMKEEEGVVLCGCQRLERGWKGSIRLFVSCKY